jgi:hypothetical protein
MIVALAGRRIDALDADSPRFPLSAVELVRGRLQELLAEKEATALVCSAACGADLLALSVAGDISIRRRVILPFEREHFRKTSVVDRPGRWAPLFDVTCDEVAEQGDLVILGCSEDDEAAYSVASGAILNEAVQLQTASQGKDGQSILAVIVWEGAPRGEDDETASFAREARSRGFAIAEILTK